MELSDRCEQITVTLSLEDWGTIMAALATAPMDLNQRYRINDSIFECARTTERLLS